MTRMSLRRPRLSLREKLGQVSWGLVLLLCLTASLGFAMLYSAANGSYDPWAWRQMMRFAVGLGLMFGIALIDVRVWLHSAYAIYAAALALLVAVELTGSYGLGAQRWVDVKLFHFQPSEVMKIALVLALARYFHWLSLEEVRRPLSLVVPAALVLAPAALVLRQPDLGTAILLVMGGGVLFVLAGVRLWQMGGALVVGLAAIPVGWEFMHAYQRERILTFLNPERDPLGAGYHILQSKIALGSGGIFGKGFLAGSQSHLNFLPEKQTDFIFTMLAEEFGLVGTLALLVLYGLILVYGVGMSVRAASQFGRLLGMGVTTTFFLYVFINIAMVTGLIPVVGVPLPLISYGGTAMMTILISFGFLMSVWIHRNVRIPRRAAAAA
ncbi:MAG: rod shape-determining protein RodA [Alphaproteobacteria bacterium]